jgi:CCR4-NOT transcription complex subunit 9
MATYSAIQSSFTGKSMPSSYKALVNDLLDNNLREHSLAELSKQREQLPDLAVVLWNRFGNAEFKLYEKFIF